MTNDDGEAMILDPGHNLTLRPMRYPSFYEMYRAAIKNTWTVDEVDFSTDTGDLHDKMSDAEPHPERGWVPAAAKAAADAACALENPEACEACQ